MQPTDHDEILRRTKAAGKAQRQRTWRERAAEGETPLASGASLAMHLTDAECAALDTIARELYHANPHDPARGELAFLFPGRAEAVRELIREWRKRNKGKRRPGTRAACAAFWRAEASWRRAKTTHRARQPVPPWK